MTVKDERLDRELYEMVGTTTTLTENDLRSYRRGDFEDPDHELYREKIDEITAQLRENETSRRAIITADKKERCMVGIHVLLRDKIHVLSWLRASDIDEYRDDDIGFLYWFGRKVRNDLGTNKRLVVHIFTSSLHSEVDR